MTLHRFQTQAANFRGNPNVLIDEDNKTIWRILCRIPVRRHETDTVRHRQPLAKKPHGATPQVA
jgi:hypothetical protein